MRKIISLLLLLASVGIFAAEQFPSRCRISGLMFSSGQIVLFAQHTAKPRLYAIHNISNNKLWLTHEVQNPSASAGWASQLFPNRWSAILIMRHRFNLICQMQQKSGAMKRVPCHQVISACQFSSVYSKHPVDASFWVVENVPFKTLALHIHRRGLSS